MATKKRKAKLYSIAYEGKKHLVIAKSKKKAAACAGVDNFRQARIEIIGRVSFLLELETGNISCYSLEHSFLPKNYGLLTAKSDFKHA